MHVCDCSCTVGIHLARAVLESAQHNHADLGSFTDEERTPEPSNNDPRSGFATPTPLPAQETALKLTENFFSRCQFPYPILVREEFIDQLTKMYAVYDDPRLHAHDQDLAQDKILFMTNMVLAISVLSLADDQPQALKLVEHYYATAITRLTSIMRKKDLSSLQCLLLFLLYSLKHSTRAPIWYISGLSMRMCIDLGLHSENTIWIHHDDDSLASRIQADTKRRLFWVTYSMDRTFSMILGRPFAFKDGSTDVQNPGVSLPENQREQTIHWIQLQRLQSEIVSQLYLAKMSESDSQFENENSDAFIADMSRRLYEWKMRAMTLADKESHPLDW
jgi:hypothetical protein